MGTVRVPMLHWRSDSSSREGHTWKHRGNTNSWLACWRIIRSLEVSDYYDLSLKKTVEKGTRTWDVRTQNKNRLFGGLSTARGGVLAWWDTGLSGPSISSPISCGLSCLPLCTISLLSLSSEPSSSTITEQPECWPMQQSPLPADYHSAH